MTRYYCSECGEECDPIEITFYYPGTHCTNGRGGTEHTGEYVSDCCQAEIDTREVDDDEETDN